MIERLRELFSFHVASPEQKTDNSLNIELVRCPLREMLCNVQLATINDNLIESEKYRKEKDFNKSIETLKSAFQRSTELLNHPCTSCVQHLRTKIFESLESINDELAKKSKGFFSRKKNKLSYIKSKSVLKEFEQAGAKNKFQFNISSKRFLGNHLN